MKKKMLLPGFEPGSSEFSERIRRKPYAFFQGFWPAEYRGQKALRV
jgi:hypothetical protein